MTRAATKLDPEVTAGGRVLYDAAAVWDSAGGRKHRAFLASLEAKLGPLPWAMRRATPEQPR